MPRMNHLEQTIIAMRYVGLFKIPEEGLYALTFSIYIQLEERKHLHYLGKEFPLHLEKQLICSLTKLLISGEEDY